MTEPGFCPHCGYNLSADEPLEDGRFGWDPRSGAYLDGVRLPLSPQTNIVFGTIMRAAGRVVPASVIIERIGTEAIDPDNVVRIRIHQIRRALGDDNPIEGVWGMGFRWSPPVPEVIAA